MISPARRTPRSHRDAPRPAGALVQARGLNAGYGSTRVVRDIDLVVHPGEVVALLGPNGAGKTTTLLTLAGELPALGGEIWFQGESARGHLHRRARRGLGLVTEDRSVFSRLTTRQNIAVAGCSSARVTALFPELEPLLGRKVGLLSGGEQRMLALAGMLARERTQLLLADELSLGLAPQAVGRLLSAVRAAADRGLGALLVEQHVHRVLSIADRAYILSQGRIQFSGTAEECRGRLDVLQGHYLGTNGAAPPPPSPPASPNPKEEE